MMLKRKRKIFFDILPRHLMLIALKICLNQTNVGHITCAILNTNGMIEKSKQTEGSNKYSKGIKVIPPDYTEGNDGTADTADVGTK